MTTPEKATRHIADTQVDEVIDRYLAAVAARLAGPVRARQAILAELHDGLFEAAHAHQARGSHPPRRPPRRLPRRLPSSATPVRSPRHSRQSSPPSTPAGPPWR
jgi:hypothetical protein